MDMTGKKDDLERRESPSEFASTSSDQPSISLSNSDPSAPVPVSLGMTIAFSGFPATPVTWAIGRPPSVGSSTSGYGSYLDLETPSPMNFQEFFSNSNIPPADETRIPRPRRCFSAFNFSPRPIPVPTNTPNNLSVSEEFLHGANDHHQQLFAESSLRNDISYLREENESLLSELSALKLNINSQLIQQGKLVKEIESMKKEMQKLKNDIKKERKKNENLTRSNQRYKNIVKDTKETKQTYMKLQKESAGKDGLMSCLAKNNDRLISEIKYREFQVQKLKSDNEVLVQQLKEKDSNLMKFKEEVQNENWRECFFIQQQKNEKQIEEINRLKNEISKLEKEIQALSPPLKRKVKIKCSVMESDPIMDINVLNADVTSTLRKEILSEKFYPVRNKVRGRAVFINNLKFKNDLRTRKGSDFDLWNISELFKKFNFIVHPHADKEKEDILDIIERESKSDIHKDHDAFVFGIFSHGVPGGVFGIDGNILPIFELVEPFNGTNCSHLRGKPKLFIILACQGDDETKGHVVGDGNDDYCLRIHEKGDMIIIYSTVQGYKSYRDEYRGTWFIRCLVQVFMENAHSDHVLDLLQKVIQEVTQLRDAAGHIQKPYFENHLTKFWHLLPGYDPSNLDLSLQEHVGTSTSQAEHLDQ